MIAVNDIHKSFSGEQVLQGLSLELPAHHILSVLGKSGCGKSTLLKVLAGLEDADDGSFTVHGEDMFALSPQKRGVVYLSQEPLLFPHLNVRDNLGFGLAIRKKGKGNVIRKVEAMAARLGLTAHLGKMPHQLSGGQKQRVNFGRALIVDPRIMLLDEPFGSLDAHTRKEMQVLFKTISQELQMTSLFVTHDLKEALLMGDRVAMMRDGKVKIYDSASEFINAPESGAREEIDFWKKL